MILPNFISSSYYVVAFSPCALVTDDTIISCLLPLLFMCDLGILVPGPGWKLGMGWSGSPGSISACLAVEWSPEPGNLGNWVRLDEWGMYLNSVSELTHGQHAAPGSGVETNVNSSAGVGDPVESSAGPAGGLGRHA